MLANSDISWMCNEIGHSIYSMLYFASVPCYMVLRYILAYTPELFGVFGQKKQVFQPNFACGWLKNPFLAQLITRRVNSRFGNGFRFKTPFCLSRRCAQKLRGAHVGYEFPPIKHGI